MTEIKILIYTDGVDTKAVSLRPDAPFSVSILRDVLEAPTSPFLKFSVEVVNRYENPQQPRKIDDALLARFDQIWIFGVFQIAVPGSFDTDAGGPDNELDINEVAALKKWMVTHGVLIAGDHSEVSPLHPPPPAPRPPVEEYLCLGRALGHKIARAGELRQWVGPPTASDDSSFNTLVQRRSKDDPDSDVVPQQYLLKPFGPDGMPHPLLVGKDVKNNDTRLDLFPDHIHEGMVILPKKPLGDDWPPEGALPEQKPQPVVIARGCDKRNCDSRDVLAIYDPPEGMAGRIIADSTWHHYLNVNLKGLKNSGDPVPFLLLQQFYRHVAFFLAPHQKRLEVTGAMLDQMLRRPEVWEEKGNKPEAIGKVALKYLSEVATRYEIAEMLQHVIASKATEAQAANLRGISFPQMSEGVTLLPARELVVGHIVSSHYREAAARRQQAAGTAENAAVVTEAVPPDPRAVAAAGVKMAFRSHGERLAEIERVTKKFLEILG